MTCVAVHHVAFPNHPLWHHSECTVTHIEKAIGSCSVVSRKRSRKSPTTKVHRALVVLIHACVKCIVGYVPAKYTRYGL